MNVFSDADQSFASATVTAPAYACEELFKITCHQFS